MAVDRQVGVLVVIAVELVCRQFDDPREGVTGLVALCAYIGRSVRGKEVFPAAHERLRRAAATIEPGTPAQPFIEL
ncbi:hypothetical protein ACFZCU_39145 [Streptomyces canus]|uniref:hypothetical protein n=1 Tax=Streptomyces canus TaxID=58343 RepID=UPI0036EDF794